MKQLQVLVIAPTPFFGDRGCHVRIYEEVQSLARLGVQSHIVTYPTGRDLSDVRIERASQLPGVQAQDLGPSLSRPLLDIGVLFAADRLIRRVQPDLIHGHLHEGIAIGSVLRTLHRIPLIADLQGSLTSELVDHGMFGADSLVAAVSRHIERWLVRRPNRILISAVSGFSLLTEQGVARHRISGLPDGVDVEKFFPQPPDPDLVSQLRLEGKRVVVFLGVLTAYQGVDLLLDVAPIVAKFVPNVHFLILGYPNEEFYRNKVSEMGLGEIVSFPGRIDYSDARRWLSLGEVAVSFKSSPTEANGKLLNYMACGLPVVASDTLVNRELLGEQGLYVSLDSIDDIATKIIEVLGDRDRARAIGESLHRRAEQLYSWPALAVRLENIYRETLGNYPSI